MAAGKINLQKASGGITAITGVDGTGNTNLVLPESGTIATMEYVDLKVALESFIGTNQSLSGNGYQKLPGGLIIQWATSATNAAGGAPFVFPVAFPNGILRDISIPQGNVWNEGAFGISSSGISYSIRTIGNNAIPPVGTAVGLIVVGH